MADEQDHIYTLESVLRAIMSERTQLGAVLDRLAARHRIKEANLDTNRVKQAIRELIDHRVVECCHHEGLTMYRKVPHAHTKLERSIASCASILSTDR